LKHIIPHQSSADAIVNSSLAYELPFLKNHLYDDLTKFLEKWRGDEKRLDGFIRAERIHRILGTIENVSDESIIPSTSLLREFIGGGAYDVH
jgi:uridine kinase